MAAGGGVFMLNLDVTIVAVALPEIQRGLDTGTETLQWIISGYLLALAVFVVTMGRLGDARGRRRLFVWGIGGFVVTSVLAGVAPSIEWLIAARVLQGIAAAAIQALSLTLIADVFPAGERGRAIGLWSGLASVSVAVGPVLGGAIAEGLGWRWIFLVNVPFGIALALISLRVLPDRRGDRVGRDLTGFALCTTGLLLLLIGIIEGRSWGWGSVETIAVFAAAAALLGTFTAVELRARAPIADLRLFTARRFAAANAGLAVSRATYYGIFFLVPFALQQSAGLTPAQAGFVLLPMVLTILISSPLFGDLADRIGAVKLIGFGMVLNGVGLGLLAAVELDGHLAPVVIALVGFALGSAAVYAPISAVGIDAVPDAKTGQGSGLMAMVRYVSAAAAVAVAVSVFQGSADARASGRLDVVTAGERSVAYDDVHRLLAGSDTVQRSLADLPRGVVVRVEAVTREATIGAFSVTMWALCAFGLVAGLGAWWFLRE